MSEPQEPESHMMGNLDEIGKFDCLNLLATGSVGRIGLIVDGKPEVLPVNYGLDGENVLFRTTEGSVLNNASMRVVAFEADHFDETTRTGWSVVVQGLAHNVSHMIDANSERIRQLSLITWAPGSRDQWFRVSPDRITGRRLRLTPDAL